MAETVLVPVFNSQDSTICKEVVKACYNGGIRVFEFTNRNENAFGIFSQLVEYVKKEMPDMILGIGSIVDGITTAKFIEAGADFVVSPAFKLSMAEICNAKKVLWIPGCGSVTEISNAQDAGAEIIKLFPGDHFGPSFIKAVKGPMPWTKVMVTGGVEPTKESIGQWISSGATCVGLGSQLFTSEIINERNYQKLENTIVELIKNR